MLIPEEVLLGGTSTELVSDNLFGVWLPRRRLTAAEHIVQSTPEFRERMAAAPQGADLGSFASNTVPFQLRNPPASGPPTAPAPAGSSSSSNASETGRS
jgi:hypothetical protein